CRVSPSGDAVAVTQSRIDEKAFIASLGIDVAPYAVIRNAADLDAADDTLFPGILKQARLGYDGKGQARVASRAEAQLAFADFGGVDCVLEQALALDYELSTVVARHGDGSVINYPASRNEHRDGI